MPENGPAWSVGMTMDKADGVLEGGGAFWWGNKVTNVGVARRGFMESRHNHWLCVSIAALLAFLLCAQTYHPRNALRTT